MAKPMVIRWNGPAWAKVKRDERRPRARNAAIKAAFTGRSEVIKSGRVNTGQMAGSFRVRSIRSGPDRSWYRIENTAPHFDYQNDGTKGPIVPVRAKYMRFKPKGASGMVFAKAVRGVRAGRFMQKAVRAVRFRDFVK